MSAATAGTHRCPGPECTEQVPAHMLMCRSHWYAVPGPIRQAVWATWKGGAGAGTPAYTAAITRAIEAVSR